MVQNRGKLMELFIGNISNAIIHSILEKAIANRGIADWYRKEQINSFDIAKRYREKINPVKTSLSVKDGRYIKDKIIRRVKGELLIRIEKGYENIDLASVEVETERVLRTINVID